jgi:hypothetical protein
MIVPRNYLGFGPEAKKWTQPRDIDPYRMILKIDREQ